MKTTHTVLIRGAWSASMVFLGTALLIGPGLSSAQPVDVPSTWGGDLWSRPRLTGNWGGLRDELGKKGVVLDVDLLLTPQAVSSGGQDTGAEFWGSTEYTLNVDTDKLGLWPGGFFKFKGASAFGNSGYGDVGAVVPVNTATLVPDTLKPATGLENATFMQFFSPKFGLLGGKIYMLDTLHGEFYGNWRTQFLNTALNFPLAFARVPLSAFGGGAIFLPSENLTLMALALDPSGTVMSNDVSKAFNDGSLVLAAALGTIKPFGLVGHQNLVGVWSDKSHLSLDQDPTNIARLLLTERSPLLGDSDRILRKILERRFPQLFVPVQPLKREDSTWAINYGFDQYFWQPAGDQKHGIGVFFNFGASDGLANPVKYSFLMGVGGNGVVPGRPHDTFGIGWARTQFSDQFIPFLRERLNLGLDHEDAFEMYYNASITPWLNVSPSVQVVKSGLNKTLGANNDLKDLDTAAVFFLRTYIRF